ncbi:MAG: bifunctional oligoribonuclease/PAP phosphatase NrnA, partial [Clostridia bacterium]|nr:bifunctional oligoribonuclease/PAP phosphatase NrnA [Clostridia bacterium]
EHRLLKILSGVEYKPELSRPDLVIAVDCADKLRMGDRTIIFDNCEETICIDHHDTNDRYAKYNFINSDAAATGEIIYEFAQFANIELDLSIACNLYVAISSDTGRFSYSNTKPHTHSIAAQLLQYDVNCAFLNSYMFEMNSKKRIKAIALAYNSFETFFDGKIAVVSLKMADIQKIGADEDDVGDMVIIPRSLETAIVSISLREVEEGVKVSLRSQSVDVAKLAQQFGGGGHVRAAGCTVQGTLEDVKRKIVSEAERRIKMEVRLR